MEELDWPFGSFESGGGGGFEDEVVEKKWMREGFPRVRPLDRSWSAINGGGGGRAGGLVY